MSYTDNNLRVLREERQLTVREVAALLAHHLNKNVDFSTVSRHETGERNITDEFAIAYAAIYKVETHKLFLTLPESD